MASYARPVERLINELSKLPSIGPKSAQRIAFHVIRGRSDDARALAEALREVKERIKPCRRCFNLTEAEECGVCTDPRRDQSVICVVEDPYDIGPIERTGEYKGLYHVLGGGALAAGRNRAGGSADSGARRAGREGGDEGDRRRHQPEHYRRGDGAVHRAGVEREDGAGDGPGERAAGRR